MSAMSDLHQTINEMWVEGYTIEEIVKKLHIPEIMVKTAIEIEEEIKEL